MDMKAKGEYREVLSAFGELVGKEQDYTAIYVKEFSQTLKEKELEVLKHLFRKITIKEIESFKYSRPEIVCHLKKSEINGLYISMIF